MNSRMGMRKKITLGFICLILLSSLVSSGIVSILIKESYYENTREKLISYNNVVNNSLNYFEAVDELKLSEYAKALKSGTAIRITFLDDKGRVLGDTDIDSKDLDNHSYREEIKAALKGETGIATRYSASLKKDMLYVAMPTNGRTEVAVIRTSLPVDEIKTYPEKLVGYLIIGALVGVLVSITLSYTFIEKMTRPINELIEVAQDISTGNYGKRVYFNKSDELSLLSEHFNRMSETLESKIQELRTSNKELDTILESMKNGVIAIDNTQNIIFLNTSAEHLFGIHREHVVGKNAIEVLRNYKIEQYIERVIRENLYNNVEEFTLEHSRIYRVTSRQMSENELPDKILGLLLIFEDVTEVRNLERIRQDFVANVSHELKTPLTSIKGFAETLKNGAIEVKETRDKFIDIIDVEAARIIALTDDLLSLSEIESTRNMPHIETIQVRDVVAEVTTMVEWLAKEKFIDYQVLLPEGNLNIQGNSNWFKQILINLVDNAIKYTPTGGEVKLGLEQTAEYLVLRVSDTGIGIDQEHVSRIFERFYRADKARSRKEGGTGLGLSIVKHIVIAFRGNIEVISEVGKGTTFTVYLPRQDV